MSRVLALLGATVGGWIGWSVASPAGFFTAFIVSTVVSGIGLWGGRRLAREWGG
jgi:hypothetical protein